MNYAELPEPRLKIGDVINFHFDNFDKQQVIRHLIRYWRLGKSKLDSHSKEIVKRAVKIINNAHRVTVVGIQVHGPCIDNGEYNICYVGGGPGWSGISFKYQLMFESKIENNHIVCIPSYGFWNPV
jgi:hypothetical protein